MPECVIHGKWHESYERCPRCGARTVAEIRAAAFREVAEWARHAFENQLFAKAKELRVKPHLGLTMMIRVAGQDLATWAEARAREEEGR